MEPPLDPFLPEVVKYPQGKYKECLRSSHQCSGTHTHQGGFNPTIITSSKEEGKSERLEVNSQFETRE
jgi:hypothetical protein